MGLGHLDVTRLQHAATEQAGNGAFLLKLQWPAHRQTSCGPEAIESWDDKTWVQYNEMQEVLKPIQAINISIIRIWVGKASKRCMLLRLQQIRITPTKKKPCAHRESPAK
jgi:hypothetical protein